MTRRSKPCGSGNSNLATKDGQPVTVAATVQVNFRLLHPWRITRLEYSTDRAIIKPILLSGSPLPACKNDGAAMTISFEVSAEGTSGGIRIVKAENVTLDEAVLPAIGSWKFQPAKQNGVAVAAMAEADLACANSSTVIPQGGDNLTGGRAGIRSMTKARLIQKTEPVYPPQARQARIQGVVRLAVVIGKDGKVQGATLIEGHPFLVPAAMDAVKQWVYEPTVVDGAPVEVRTEVDIQFTLAE